MSRTCIVLLVSVLGACAACGAPDSIRRMEDQRRVDATDLVDALGSGSADRRARAALAMGRIQSPGYAGPLAQATGDPDPALRQVALFALGQLGLAKGATVPSEAVESCRGALDDPDPDVVVRAIEALGKLATPEVPEIVRPFLDHAVTEVRSEAAMALFRCRFVPTWREQTVDPPPLPESVVDALARALLDPEPDVRRSAAYAFSRYGQPRAVLELATLVYDDDEWTRLFAVRAIGKSGDDSVAGVIRHAMTDASAAVRVEAVQALDALGLAAELGSDLAADSSFHVRAAQARALDDSEGGSSLDLLRKLEGDVSLTVRSAAVTSLTARLGAEYVSALEHYVAAPDWRIRAAAAAAAGQLAADGLPLIRRGFEDEDRRVRAAALGAIEGLDVGEALIFEALESDDLALRGTAVGLLAGREHPDRLARLTAAYDASAGVEWIEIREAVVDAVANLEGAGALLERIAGEDPAPSVRGKALIALFAEDPDATRDAGPRIEVSEHIDRAFGKDPVVTLETNRGTMRIRCLSDEAPIHVAAFVDRVQAGFYDGLSWHRVVSNFVIQGGDPRGDGWGGTGDTLRDEIHMRRYARGSVGMPKAGKDTGSCQIFITHLPTPHLDGNYTIFGEVIEGLEVVDRIEVGDTIVTATLEP